MDPLPLHRRSLDYEAFGAGDELRIVGRLRDERPWAEGTSEVNVLHDMELSVTVRRDDLTITRAVAQMNAFPHRECPAVVAAFANLTGLRVGRGYTRQVQERFGGTRGCTHLEHLARSLGPVVVQATTSYRARTRTGGEPIELVDPAARPWARGSCHVWAEGGPAEQKLAAGWRPGVGPYPAPLVADVVEESGS